MIWQHNYYEYTAFIRIKVIFKLPDGEPKNQAQCRKLQNQKAFPFYLQLPADFCEIKQNQHETQLEVLGMYRCSHGRCQLPYV